MRTFRVVSVLNRQDFTNCFSVHGALKRPHKGEKYRSLRAAEEAAQRWAEAGWYATVVRRLPHGWEKLGAAAPITNGVA
jgi:hypothetical protein